MSRFKQIRDAIRAGVPEDEAVANALGVSKSSNKRKSNSHVSAVPNEELALPTMADAFKRAKVKKRK